MLRVIIRRYPDNYTLLGRDLIVIPLDTALDKLLFSGFMREWIKDKMREHLEKGGNFTCLADTGNPKSVYTLATEAEIMELAVQGKLDQARSDVGGGIKAPRRSGKTYKFTLPEGKARDEVLKQLKGQGRLMIEFVIESGVFEYSVEALEALLEKNRPRLNTKPERKLLELFRFHMSETYKKMGIVEVVEPRKDEGEDDDGSEEDAA